MKTTPRIFYLILLLFALTSCGKNQGELELSGVLETDDYDQSASFSAKLIEIRFSEGDSVHIGDTIAVLDTTVVGAKRRAALSAVSRARANMLDLLAGSDKEKILAAESRVQNTIALLGQAERDLKRYEKLHTEGLVNDQELERIQLNVQTAQNNKKIAEEELADLKRGARTHEVGAAEAVLAQAEAELAAAQKDFSDAFMVAAIAGQVQLIPFQIGEMIPAGRSVATIQSGSILWVKIFIPEDQLDRVKTNDSLSFSVDAYPDKKFTAVITHIASAAEFTPRNVQTQDERLNLVFAVKLRVVTGLSELRAGMPADFVL